MTAVSVRGGPDVEVKWSLLHADVDIPAGPDIVGDVQLSLRCHHSDTVAATVRQWVNDNMHAPVTLTISGLGLAHVDAVSGKWLIRSFEAGAAFGGLMFHDINISSTGRMKAA